MAADRDARTPETPQHVFTADDFEQLALMGRTPDGRFVLGDGAAERVLAHARRMVSAESLLRAARTPETELLTDERIERMITAAGTNPQALLAALVLVRDSHAAQRRALWEVVNDTLNHLYKHGNGSAEECNLWERLHAAIGCKECVAKRAELRQEQG